LCHVRAVEAIYLILYFIYGYAEANNQKVTGVTHRRWRLCC